MGPSMHPWLLHTSKRCTLKLWLRHRENKPMRIPHYAETILMYWQLAAGEDPVEGDLEGRHWPIVRASTSIQDLRVHAPPSTMKAGGGHIHWGRRRGVSAKTDGRHSSAGSALTHRCQCRRSAS